MRRMTSLTCSNSYLEVFLSMELQDFLPESGHVQRLYCSDCKKHLDLKFTDFNEVVSGVEINISDFPTLHCSHCNNEYLPDESKLRVIYVHDQAIKNASGRVDVTRNKINQKFEFTTVPFIYDSDDYNYIPGLRRPWDEGFLTPVFFNKDVLLKYDSSPTYRLSFASTTYGTICRGDDFSMPFGLNKNGKIVMWLGDIARLPESEQYYLRSENVASDHSIGSEFYDSQIECFFTDPSKEDELFKYRSLFLESCFKRFGKKIAHLDQEVYDISVSLNAPLIDTEKERRYVADTLNKIYLESFDNNVLGSVLSSLGGDPKSLGSLKRLQKVLELTTSSTEISSLMSPFYVLYDLRVAYSHLGSKEGNEKKLDFVKERLNVSKGAGLLEIYDSLVNKLASSLNKLTELLGENT